MSGPIFLLALAFFLAENSYFGWNAMPKSDAELIADGIVFLLLALAFIAPTTTIKIGG